MCLACPALCLLVSHFFHVKAAAVLRHYTTQKWNGIVQFAQKPYERSVVKTKTRKMFYHLHIRHIAYHMVVDTAEHIHQRVLAAAGLYAAHHFMSLLPFRYQLRYQFHRILEVTANGNGTIARSLTQAVEGRIELSEIGHIEYSLDLLILRTDLLELFPGAVRGCIIYEYQLIVILRKLFF